METPLPTLLTHYMRASDKELRVAALWIVINLTYTYVGEGGGYECGAWVGNLMCMCTCVLCWRGVALGVAGHVMVCVYLHA